MYELLLSLHSWLRWLVLLGIVGGICLSLQGFLSGRVYDRMDNWVRLFTKTASDTQILLGFWVYFGYSPFAKHYLSQGDEGNYQVWFFGLFHPLMMFLAMILLSVGSSACKRQSASPAKFKTTLIFFSLSLGLILCAIPWFRPFFRTF